ncbi:family 78 glycoside hydrolase catalytic domain [Amycolatopsis suaedae]|uniref:alpha-L-rhamnosidase n=1 Tax=Amycolatopsis suaedae TaxID=2510978 RepID=A0A4Q7IX16_9PSEU|nr:family 78 glycoside hydrolase catalytic domain [Amycolatopsis suaedae]RZQ59470.1 hydrolase [Amycolatopsis suaedae]
MTRFDRRVFLRRSATGAGLVAGAAAFGGPAAAATPGGGRKSVLRVDRCYVEHAPNLLGTDTARPRLSWALAADGHGATQTAYQLEVGTRPGHADVWRGDRVPGDTQAAVYAGPDLKPSTRYFWRVRVWDAHGGVSGWSEPGWWETALLGRPWQASWIGAPEPEPALPFAGASWIWTADGSTSGAPPGPRWFRGAVDLPAGVRRVRVVATADDDFTLYCNGERLLHAPQRTDGWRTGRQAEAAPAERLVLAAVATNRGGASVNPAGLLVRLVAETASGERELVTGPGWRATDAEVPGWTEPGFDDSGWAPATVLAPYGQGPWGSGVSVPVTAPAPLLRKGFRVDRPIAGARLYIAGLAYYEAELNGRRVGTQVLDPGFTAYHRTVLYATHDVTAALRHGDNALGVTLGRGFHSMTTPSAWRWTEAFWRAEPKLLARLEVEHPDGTRTVVVSDGGWRVAESPTRFDSLYEGETYDARLAVGGWSEPGFDDSGWAPAVVRPAPAGAVRAQQHEPIEIVESVRPASVREVKPGTWVADLGRTTAGWVRVSADAPRGTVVSVRYGEKVRDDGTVDSFNEHVYTGRSQVDEYVSAGTGTEAWEPRFSYKGFRHVEITGARPSDILGRVVHSAVPAVSDFGCSEPLFETFDRAMRRTLLNNLHGLPTDTPMYEKNGWTGDAQLGAPTMAAAFDMRRLFTKWLSDIADGQNDAGQPPVIVPSGGWGYRELAPAPEWTTVYPFVLRGMHRWYGDTELVRAHWRPLTRYLDYELGRLVDGLAVTALGDYLPPGYPGGIPPEDTRLTATAYLHRALIHTAELGTLLGEQATAARYRGAADDLRTALNTAFLAPEGHYRTAKDPDYRQTSNAVPLAFGLVPAGAVGTVVASLAADVRRRGNHLNTGALGTSVLLPVLTAHGHADLAHAVATQRTYPSWGHWFDNGADTMWEMWHLGSRSRDHYFQGTVTQWLYENVAGLRPGEDGYRTFTVRPDARVGLSWARFGVDTVRGRAAVSWSRDARKLRMRVQVPVGSVAEVHVPAQAGVESSPAASVLRTEPGYVVLRVPSGFWRFTSDDPDGR